MNVHDFLAAAAMLPVVDLSVITNGGGLVVVAPHPDDESLGCGGLIAEACARGVPVRLIVVSNGVGSHRKSPSYPASRLEALRRDETIAAAAELGLGKTFITFLGLPDAAVPTTGSDADHARASIVAAVDDCSAGVVCVTWRHDPHCDHSACASLVEAACAPLAGVRVLAYPIWAWTLPAEANVAGLPSGMRLDVSQHLARKQAAIAAHRSQTTDLIDDDPDGFRLDAAMLERFASRFELFLTCGSEP